MDIGPLREGDLELLDTTMLAEDRIELDAVTSMTTLELLRYSADVSIRVRSVRYDGELMAVYGLGGHISSGVGVPWLVAAAPVLEHPLSFLRASRQHLSDVLGVHPLLENWVWDGNQRALRWLRYLGFELDEPRPYGRHGELFRRFTMRDPTCAA